MTEGLVARKKGDLAVYHTTVDRRTHTKANAINARHFDCNASPWIYCAKDFEMTSTNASRSRATNIEQLVGDFERISAGWPAFQIEATKMETHIFREADYAEIYMNAQSSGGPSVPVGMTRKTVSMHEFKKIDGHWVAVRETTFFGIGDGVAYE